MVTALGVLLPIVFVVGVAARKPVPSVASLPAGLLAASRTFVATQWEHADLFTKLAIHVRLLRESADAGRCAVELSAPKDFVKPDLIVYWVAGYLSITDTLPDNVLLLGAFNPSVALPLPPEATSANGVLVLYSLADHEVIAVSKSLGIQKP